MLRPPGLGQDSYQRIPRLLRQGPVRELAAGQEGVGLPAEPFQLPDVDISQERVQHPEPVHRLLRQPVPCPLAEVAYRIQPVLPVPGPQQGWRAVRQPRESLLQDRERGRVRLQVPGQRLRVGRRLLSGPRNGQRQRLRRLEQLISRQDPVVRFGAQVVVARVDHIPHIPRPVGSPGADVPRILLPQQRDLQAPQVRGDLRYPVARLVVPPRGGVRIGPDVAEHGSLRREAAI